MSYRKVPEIAQELGVSTPVVYRAVKDLPSVKQGRTNLYDTDVVKSVLEKKKSVDTPQLSMSELGSSAFKRWGNTVAEEKLRQLRGREGRILLREMRINDPVIAAVFLAIENALRRVSWRVKAASEAQPDVEAATFVEECLADMSFSFNDELQFILAMLEQGFSALEIVYKKRNGVGSEPSSQYDDGRIGWRKWAPRPAESLAPGNEWIFDENGGVHGIRQEIEDGAYKKHIVEIPIEKLLLFRTTVAPSNSPEGLPVHRSAYVPWWMSNNIQEIEGIGIERDLAGIPVIYMGGDTKKRGSGSDFEQAKDIVVNLRVDEQAGVVFPYAKLGTGGENRGMLLELISTSGRRSYDTSRILERYAKQKAMAMLAQFITLGMDAVGSYALGRMQADIFVLAVSAWATNIAETINRFAIPRLMKYNVFPGTTGYPEVVPSDVGIPNLEEMAVYVNYLTQAGLLKPDIELERHLRQIAHLPQRIESTGEDGQYESSSTGQASERAILRAARAGLILERLRRLQQGGILSPEQAGALIAQAKEELMAALAESQPAGESTADIPLLQDDEDAET